MKNNPIHFGSFHTALNNDIHFKGEIISKQDILIAGSVEGQITCDKTLHLLDSAEVSNMINAQNCTIYGAKVKGTMHISERLKVYNKSDITGSIKSGVLDVEAGAHINGTIKMRHRDETGEAPSSAPREQG